MVGLWQIHLWRSQAMGLYLCGAGTVARLHAHSVSGIFITKYWQYYIIIDDIFEDIDCFRSYYDILWYYPYYILWSYSHSHEHHGDFHGFHGLVGIGVRGDFRYHYLVSWCLLFPLEDQRSTLWLWRWQFAMVKPWPIEIDGLPSYIAWWIFPVRFL